MTLLRIFFRSNIFRQQSLAFFCGDASASAVVRQLCAVDTSHGEVTGFAMEDEHAADAGRRLDRVTVCQCNAQLSFSIQTVEDDALQRMVRTGGIAKSNAEHW